MSTIRETVFDLVFNAFLQIGFFAIVAAVFSRLVARAKAKYQYLLYSAVFVFCLAAPVINTLWQSHPVMVAEKSLRQVLPQAGGTNHRFWPWQDHSKVHEQFTIRPEVQNWIVAIWGLFVLSRLVHFSRGVHRVHRLRKEASVLSPAAVEIAGQIIEARHRVALLESMAIDDPVTVGVFHPAILLPSKVLPDLREQDLSAILAHEYGHILRRDFLAHILCELISLPVAWHPAIRYLKSKISQTRELACDEYAAVRLGKRTAYARTLLRLASLCLRVPRSNAVGLGIFDGDNLENRIMMLTETRTSLSRAGLIGLALATSFLFGSSTVLARTVSLQEVSASTNTGHEFAGTWHWMFKGRSFATMILVQNGSGIIGSVTPSKIALDNDELSMADPADDSTPVQISKTRLEGNALHVTVGDGNQPFEFLVTLKDATHAEIHPIGAPPKMKPIQAERVN